MKHSLMFFLAWGLIASLVVILIPRFVRGATPPAFCAYDRTNGDNVTCLGSRPFPGPLANRQKMPSKG